jgi:3-isopropylmalate/(R)-2-methylmalate dehydratase small subunit
VWALAGAGIRAVVSTAFADIFRGNALGNGLLPIEVSDATMATLRASWDSPPVVTIVLATQSLTLPNGRTVTFPISTFAKHCLLHGADDLDVLVEAGADIDKYEATHPAFVSTLTASAGE